MNADAFYEMVECAIPKLDSILSAHEPGTSTAPSELAFAFPVAVCSAFAIELYLKAIIGMEIGEYATGHDLVDLFKRVSCSSKSEIEFPYGEEGKEFNSKLEGTRFAFEEVRYFEKKKRRKAQGAENKNAPIYVENNFLYALMNKCKKRAHDLREAGSAA